MPSSSNAKSKIKAHGRDRHSRSRNTTPVSATSASVIEKMETRRTMERSTSPYLTTSLTHPPLRATKLSNSPITDIFDDHSPSPHTGIPSASSLTAIADGVKSVLLNVIKDRDEACDQTMRELASRKKERMERDRMRELEQAKLDALQMHKKEKASSAKERPLALGAHSVARQDGSNGGRATSSPLSPTLSQPPSAKLEKPKDAEIDGDSDEEESQHQPPPAAAVQHYQYFGDDPTRFPDSTIYEILPVTDETTEAEKKAIYGVAFYPPSDLHDLTPGTPPDKDFSNAKPASQVTAQTFANYVEPYLRPLTQEDLAFLSERGDRSAIFEIPKRGPRHYKEIWAEEDGSMLIDGMAPKIPTNEARGNLEMMNDDVAESDEVSTGPVAARVLSLLRPITRPPEDQTTTNGTEMEIDGEGGNSENKPSQPPATQFPEQTWKNMPPPVTHDYQTMDSRLVEELRHIGFLSPAEAPSFTDVQDDEVTARLRYLQRELRRVSMVNGARKARVLEIATERMATQEWQGIMDDLDTQLNQAYLKRTRNIGKGKKGQVKGRPSVGTAVPLGSGTARGVGVGEPIRSLMERREQWNQLIGPVVDHGKVSVPKETIFEKENMARLIKAEQENWVEDEADET